MACNSIYDTAMNLCEGGLFQLHQNNSIVRLRPIMFMNKYFIGRYKETILFFCELPNSRIIDSLKLGPPDVHNIMA